MDDEAKEIEDYIRQTIRSEEWRRILHSFEPKIQESVALAMSQILGYGIRVGLKIAKQKASDDEAESK
jgi:hypothetical protein